MPAGRPTAYRAEFVERVAKLSESGLTDAEIADDLGVHKATLYRWKIEHPEFRDALKDGKEVADERVVASLYKRATGFEHDAIKVSFDKEGNPIYAPYREYVVPDVTAQIFWMKNRKPQEWRDKSEVHIPGLDVLAERIASARKRK